MWEEWRAEIDRSLREAQLAEASGPDQEHWSEVGGDAEKEGAQARLFRLMTRPRGRGQARRELPAAWRLRGSQWRARPVL